MCKGSRTFVYDHAYAKAGKPIPFFKDAVALTMAEEEVGIKLELHLGTSSATAWGCDISEEYVSFNSEYTT